MGTERKRKVSLFDVVDEPSVTTAKVAKANGNGGGTMPLINPWNGRPYSAKFYEILEKRKTLPVWQQKEEFLKALKESQSLILVGETGSGKTTQVCSVWLLNSMCYLLILLIYYCILILLLVKMYILCLILGTSSNFGCFRFIRFSPLNI